MLGLAVLLWPLLAVFLMWTCRRPGPERIRTLFMLGAGALTGMTLVVLLGQPDLVLSQNARSLSLLFSDKQKWLQYAVASPLGALIAYFLSQTTEDSS